MATQASRNVPKPRRRKAEERRAEIVECAAGIAMTEGTSSVTMQRVAAELEVYPGLISHYFATADDLVAAAFSTATTQALDEAMDVAAAENSPLDSMRALIRHMVGVERDTEAILWLDAWHASLKRPALEVAVATSMQAWIDRLVELADAGVATGQFVVQDTRRASLRILAVVDGLTVQAVMRSSMDYSAVHSLLAETAERELGLPEGSLDPDATTQ